MVYRVVVADAQAEFRDWLRSMLSVCQDFELVGEASTGTEVLCLVDLLAPDLLIIDLYTPDLDGFEVARYIRQRYPGIKTIVVSAYWGRIYERLAREEGALAFIPKADISVHALLRALDEAG